MPEKSEKSERRPFELIKYRKFSYSYLTKITSLPLYEPEVLQALSNYWDMNNYNTETFPYTFEPFDKKETRYAQYAREWWVRQYQKIFYTRLYWLSKKLEEENRLRNEKRKG